MRRKSFAQWLPFLFFVVMAALLVSLLKAQMQQAELPPISHAVRALPEFTIDGLKHSDINGPALLHFTASWCAVCAIEHAELMQLSKRLPIYGVAWKDDKATITRMLKEKGMPYRKLGHDSGALGLELGLSGTPESYLISREGNIIAHIKGPLTEGIIAQEINPRLP